MSSEDIEDWNRIAASYAQFAGPEDFINRQFAEVMCESLSELRGLHCLDLGCGGGWLSQQMHAAGAQVLGIDGSIELINTAQENFPGIEFRQGDLSLGLPKIVHKFHRIVANMVLMDIPDLTQLFKSVSAALAPQGRFIFTMQHPCFFNMKSHRDDQGNLYRKVTGYLAPETWRIEGFGGHNHYHRSLTYYFDLLRANNMAVTRFYEPPHIVQNAADKSEQDLAYYRSIPVFLLVEAMAL